MNSILILGATSDIAKAIAHCYAQNGYNLELVARDLSELQLIQKDLEIRYNNHINIHQLDILDWVKHKKLYELLKEKIQGIIVCVGYLGDQPLAQTNSEECQKILSVNFCSVVNFLNLVAEDFEQKKSGFIVGISSVAGDRGRKSNYFYGASKAGLTAYLSGLRQRLARANVNVLTVKPGFVDTKMTQGMQLPTKLLASPQQVAQEIFNAQQKNKNILYSKSIWKWIMLIIIHLPEFIFKKTNI